MAKEQQHHQRVCVAMFDSSAEIDPNHRCPHTEKCWQIYSQTHSSLIYSTKLRWRPTATNSMTFGAAPHVQNAEVFSRCAEIIHACDISAYWLCMRNRNKEKCHTRESSPHTHRMMLELHSLEMK